MNILSPPIEAHDLIELRNSAELVLVDASNLENYSLKHLDGAVYVDLATQLSDPTSTDASRGGRHPLPPISKFLQTLSELGISAQSHVVIYDHAFGANAAARFWWMLKAVGHQKVQVLNGGFPVAQEIGFPINSDKVEIDKSELYQVNEWKLNTVSMHQVKEISETNLGTIVDVRSEERYRGESEPIDLVAGHIPNAINIPYASNLDQNGRFLSSEILQEMYKKELGNSNPNEVVFHCGSGVTACHSILALTYAGFEIPRLYVGSWSEWSRNPNPILP